MNKRELLLDAGKELIADLGLNQVKVSDITKKAGVAKGTFYTYFTSKEELMIEVIQSNHERVKKKAIGAIDEAQGLKGKVETYIDGIYNVIVNDSYFCKIMCQLFMAHHLPDKMVDLKNKMMWEKNTGINHIIEQCKDELSKEIYERKRYIGQSIHEMVITYTLLFLGISGPDLACMVKRSDEELQKEKNFLLKKIYNFLIN